MITKFYQTLSTQRSDDDETLFFSVLSPSMERLSHTHTKTLIENHHTPKSKIIIKENYRAISNKPLILPTTLNKMRKEETPINTIELMLSQSLKDKNPQLNPDTADKKILQIAIQDLLNYLQFHWKLTGRQNAKIELTERIQSYSEKNPKELQQFIDLWSGIWMKKWNERVKILIANEDHLYWKKTNQRQLKAEPLWRQLPYRNEMKDMIINTLIRNGEICGTSILAENLIKTELTKYAGNKIYANQKLLSITRKAVKKARHLSQSKGPLIFVRIDKRFFQLLK
jgi:hypothetical protein